MSAELRTGLVTGASAGIGAAVAHEMARLGWRVAIGARRVERLQELATELRSLGAADVFAGSLDVGDADSVENFFGKSEAAIGPSDVIVNNAGVSIPYRMHEYPVEQLRTEVETNVLGMLFVTRRALRALLERELGGDIVFMSSDATNHPRPGQLVYGATKAAMENLATGLAKELEGTGVRVTKIRIGPTFSEFGSSWPTDPDEWAARSEWWGRFGLRDQRLKGVMLAAEDVAKAALHAVTRPRGVWIDTIEIQPDAPVDRGDPAP
jgi:NADP-dependent 3-hydroxy acid dehydrogenase YdfG